MVFGMLEILSPHGIVLQTCCEKELLERLPQGLDVEPSACVPNELLMQVYGGKVSTRRDSGQRVRAGCGCRVSVDIGSYTAHPCHHKCLYCYARPASS